MTIRSWAAPLVAAGVLAIVGGSANWTLERSMKDQLRGQLRTTLRAEVSALGLWADGQRRAAQEEADQPPVRELVARLAALPASAPAEAPSSSLLPALRRQLQPAISRHAWSDFFVFDPTGALIGSGSPLEPTHRTLAAAPFVAAALQGQVVVSKPFRPALGPQEDPDAGAATTAMFVAAPVHDGSGRLVGALAFRIRPELEFDRIFTVARMGRSGETYAFDETGLMVSPSRFDAELRAVGLLPAGSEDAAMLNVEIRDPGGNLLAGHRPETPRKSQPLTLMAARATSGETGVDVDGYRDYRGVPVVGAWTWQPELGIGVATEIDVDEAFATLHILRRGFLGLFGLLVIGAIGIVYYSNVVSRLQQNVAQARKLGQYRLLQEIGRGGMGKVYRASHLMLRRPTAIKLILSDAADEKTVARFEREVRITSRLTHPNTVEIYDFGRTSAGTFYYAMEYLEGFNLAQLVEVDGPQPEARVIHILRQACGSLAEAHARGLIHRDIKPANLMLCERGGIHDFVKILDFGLARPVDRTVETALTAAGTLTGTPDYLAPEAIDSPDSVDGQSDLYQLGAVAYFLLTGEPLFTGSVIEVCRSHLESRPQPPSTCLGREVSPDLEALVLQCLEKERHARPASAAVLEESLAGCNDADGWSQRRAAAWWEDWLDVLGEEAERTVRRPPDSEQPGVVIDLGRRNRSDSVRTIQAVSTSSRDEGRLTASATDRITTETKKTP